MHMLGKIGLGFVGLVTIGTLVSAVTMASDPKFRAEQNAKEAAGAKTDAAHMKRMELASEVGRAIKSSAREPQSITFDEVRVSDDAKIACVIYRGRNGFNGMAVEHAVFKNGEPLQSAHAWNKNCRAVMEIVTFAA